MQLIVLQLPVSDADHAYGRESQYDSNIMFDYSDHPRARAHALAYAPEHAQSSQGHVTDGRVRNRDASALFEDNGYKTPYDNYSDRHGSPPPHSSFRDDVAGAWSPEARGDRSGHAQGTRRRQPSEISYDEDSAPHQGPAQRRRTASPPDAEGYSSPPRVGSDVDENEDNEDNNEEEEDEDEADLSRPDFPKVQRLTVSARSKQGDYDEEAQEAMALAVVHFKSMIMSEHAYPSKLTDKIWATTAWYRAVEQLHIELAPNQDVLKLVRAYILSRLQPRANPLSLTPDRPLLVDSTWRAEGCSPRIRSWILRLQTVSRFCYTRLQSAACRYAVP